MRMVAVASRALLSVALARLASPRGAGPGNGRCLAYAIAVGLSLSGCARGIAEFQLYLTAFAEQYRQGNEVLDRLAVAEREAWHTLYDNPRIVRDFDPQEAAFYLDGTDPPTTASLRASFKVLQDYNAALGGLANGEAAAALAGHVGSMSRNLLATVGALGALTANPAVVATFVVDGGVTLDRISPLIGSLTGLVAREAFRRELIAAYPLIDDLIEAMRASAPDMFELMRVSYIVRGSFVGVEGIPVTDLPALETDRRMLASWVLLLDESRETIRTAVGAAMSRSSASDLSALTAASAELLVLAEQLKLAVGR